MAYFRQRELAVRAIAPGRRRAQVHTDNLMMVVFDFDEGPWAAPDPPHSHPHEQISYVVSGRVRFILGEQTADLEAGDLITVPAGVPHSIQLLGPSARLADAFHPPREDFLSEEKG